MSKIIVKTMLPNPPSELWYCWGEPYQKFTVTKDGTVEGLTPDHPRYHILKTEWKLVEEAVEEKPKKGKEVQDG
jgi:hypothetical protein